MKFLRAPLFTEHLWVTASSPLSLHHKNQTRVVTKKFCKALQPEAEPLMVPFSKMLYFAFALLTDFG